jgi:nitrate/TMAO reductase-like tetraheme cytochrome c subunit
MPDPPQPPVPKQPVLVLLTSHWISMAGVALVTLAGFAWLFVLPQSLRDNVSNPYIGLLVFIAIPAVFIAGLILIPIGIAFGRRHIAQAIDTPEVRRLALRRAGMFFAIMTVVNLVIASQASYRAVEHMDTVQFCGQTCHVMKPEFTAHLLPPHQQVSCASCHIVPGATGFVKAKLAGTRQLMGVVFNSYPRPIASALESNRLVSSAETCEQCHTREKYIGPRLRVISRFKDDEANTRTETVLMMLVGGGTVRGKAGGIHGAHVGPGVHIRYAAADSKRENIPWIEYRGTPNGAAQTYLAMGATPESVRSLPVYEMQCVDCHNRAAHKFTSPENAVDEAMAAGTIPAGLPFLKKTAVELLKAGYPSQEEATQKISAGLSAFYQNSYPAIWAARSSDVQLAAAALSGIYGQNVFPDLKVTWGTYANNLGHMDDPGCFRCHDDSHATATKATIPQDCDTCHQALAMEETNPAILKTLGIGGAILHAEQH